MNKAHKPKIYETIDGFDIYYRMNELTTPKKPELLLFFFFFFWVVVQFLSFRND